jgi:hypothetical protein
MTVNDKTIQVSFRLPQQLVERMRDVSTTRVWPPPPSQTEIVARGIELVLRRLERRGSKARAEAE